MRPSWTGVTTDRQRTKCVACFVLFAVYERKSIYATMRAEKINCSNEHFTLGQYIQANCEYPGKWDGKIERLEFSGDLTILVGNILSKDNNWSLHVVNKGV